MQQISVVSNARSRLIDHSGGKNITIAYEQKVCTYHSAIADIVVASARRETNGKAQILDYGCGVGNTIRELQRRAPNSFVFHLFDIDNQCLELAAQVSGVEAKYSAEELLTKLDRENIYDVVVCSHVLHYDFHFHQTLMTLKRLTKPGGLLIIAVPNAISLPIIANTILRRSYGKGPVVAWDWSSLENLIGSYDFETTKLLTDYVPIPLLAKFQIMQAFQRWLKRPFPRFGFSLIAVCTKRGSQ